MKTCPRSAAFLLSVARALERTADRLDPPLERALRTVYEIDKRVELAQALEREAVANVTAPRSVADECTALLREQEAELEREIAAESPESRRLRLDIARIPDPASPGDVWPPLRRIK